MTGDEQKHNARLREQLSDDDCFYFMPMITLFNGHIKQAGAGSVTYRGNPPPEDA